MKRIIQTVLISLVLGIWGYSAVWAEEKKPDVLYLKGEISKFDPNEKKFIKIEPAGITTDGMYRSGGDLAPDVLEKTPEKLQDAGLMLAYPSGDMLSIPNGSSLEVKTDDKGKVDYMVKGQAHVYLWNPKDEVREVQVNGIVFKSKYSRLFIRTFEKSQHITLVEGEVEAQILDDASKPKGDPHLLKAQDRLELTEKEIKVSNQVDLKDPVYQNSLIPLREKDKTLQKIGLIEFTKAPLMISRFQEVIKVQHSPTLLFTHDEIQTVEGQVAILKFDTKDRVRLTNKSQFKVSEYEVPQQKKTISFNFLGKIRSKFIKRAKKRSIRFKTVTAVIGIKGTDFEAVASDQGTSVATIEGVVGVADADGQNEVDVTAGMQTEVKAGEKPSAPVAIPPAQLQELMGDPQFQADATADTPPLTAAAVPDEGGEGDNALPVLQSQIGITGSAEPRVGDINNLTVSENESVHFQWSKVLAGAILKVGQEAISLNLEEDGKTATLSSQEIQKLALSQEHIVFQLIGTDENNIAGTAVGLLKFKKEGPTLIEPIRVSGIPGTKDKNTGLSNLVIGNGESAHFTWSADLATVQLSNSNAAVQLQLAEDGKTATLTPELLVTLKPTFTPSVIRLTATDRLGGKTVLNGILSFDKKAPQLVLPIQISSPTGNRANTQPLDNLMAVEGESLQFKWSEPLNLAVLKHSMGQVILPLSADGLTATLSAPVISQLSLGRPQTLFNLTAVDKLGKSGSIQGLLGYRSRPTGLPAMTIKNAKGEDIISSLQNLPVNQVGPYQVEANRPIVQWNVFLDQQKLLLPLRPMGQAGNSISNSLTLPVELFRNLADGKHQLLIAGIDQFQMQGQLPYDFVLDRVPPILKQPIQIVGQIGTEVRTPALNNLRMREGESFQLNWSEPIRSLKLSLMGQSFDLRISADGLRSTLNSSLVRPLVQMTRQAPIQLLATDLAGNQRQFIGNLVFEPKPTSPPKITIGLGKSMMMVNELADLVVRSDRELINWQVAVDNVEKRTDELLKGKKSTLTLPKAYFAGLKEGHHLIDVSGVDAYGLKGQQQLFVQIDRQMPAIGCSSHRLENNLVKLKKGEKLQIVWNEALSKIDVSIGDRVVKTPLSTDGKSILIYGDPEVLTVAPKSLKIVATDIAGNEKKVFSKLALKTERRESLKRHYDETVLSKTKSSVDHMLLVNRARFRSFQVNQRETWFAEENVVTNCSQ